MVLLQIVHTFSDDRKKLYNANPFNCVIYFLLNTVSDTVSQNALVERFFDAFNMSVKIFRNFKLLFSK